MQREFQFVVYFVFYGVGETKHNGRIPQIRYSFFPVEFIRAVAIRTFGHPCRNKFPIYRISIIDIPRITLTDIIITCFVVRNRRLVVNVPRRTRTHSCRTRHRVHVEIVIPVCRRILIYRLIVVRAISKYLRIVGLKGCKQTVGFRFGTATALVSALI